MSEDRNAETPQDSVGVADAEDPQPSETGDDRNNEILIPEPEIDPADDSARLAVWGRLGGRGEPEPLAVYWEIGTELPDGEDGEEDENAEPKRDVPLEENYMEILSGEEDLQKYDPALARDEFYRRLLDYRIDDKPAPETALAEYRETFEEYLNAARFNWLKQFVREEDEDELANWFKGFLGEIFTEGLPYYRLNVTFSRPDTRPEESLEESGDDFGTLEGSSTEEDSSGATVDITLMTDPEQGVQAPDLKLGQEVFLRIVGPHVEKLPDDLVERDRSTPSSVPMVGPITDIDQ